MHALLCAFALQVPLAGTHPAFERRELQPESFAHEASAIAFRPGGDLVLCDARDGSVWSLSGVLGGERAKVRPLRVAAGLDRPVGVCFVAERLFVLQRDELTELLDLDHDGVADTYRSLCAAWRPSTPDETVRGLVYHESGFDIALGTGARARIALADGLLEPRAGLAGDELPRTTFRPEDGPYAGQSCRASEDGRELVREVFEEIEGERQACVLRWTSGSCCARGPDGALYVGGPEGVARLSFNGRGVLDLLAVHARTNGFELEFTEPIANGYGWDPALWSADPLAIRSANVSADRKHVELELAGLEQGQQVHLRALGPLPSEQGTAAWSTEATYTIRALPKDRPVDVLARPKRALEPGWTTLFDGRDTSHWRGYKLPDMPAQGWSIENGVLENHGGGGDLVSREEYADFELTLEWKISAGGNSGILFHASEDHEHVWESAPEMQILDDARNEDGKSPKTSAGSNYALHAPPPGTTRPVGCWNEVRLCVRGSHVEHWQNGVKLLEYELWSPEWKALVAASKFAKMPGYGLNKAGRIALQDHGDPVSFRDIRIRPLVR